MSISFQELFPAAPVVAVQGKPYLFTNMRIDRKTLPKGFYAYDVRDDSCDGECWQFQHIVRVDHWGTIIGLEELELDNNGQFWADPDPDEPDYSSEGQNIGFYMDSQADYVVWYHSLKSYAQAAQQNN